MKVVIKDSPNGDEVKFPCLMQDKDGAIVLMSSKNVGVVITQGLYHIGYFAEDWLMHCFTPFNGTVELSND